MSSRKEQKEALRREREERERAAKEAERRRRLIGYGAGGALALAAVVVLVLVLAGGGGGNGDEDVASLLPSGGEAPDQKLDDLEAAAEAAGCRLRSFGVEIPSEGRHTADIEERIKYQSNPPAGGRHFQEAAGDGPYDEAPPDSTLVHTLEHGRIVIWFKPSLPRADRANLKALFDEDDYHMVLAPRRNMDAAVAATAWGAEPQPEGTGYTLTCPRLDDGVFDAIRSFKDEHRDNGPEVVP